MRTLSNINIFAILILSILFAFNLQAQNFTNTSNFLGTYYGKLDGRNAKLQISTYSYNRAWTEFDITLMDLDRGVTMKGRATEVHREHGGDHVLQNVIVKSVNGKTIKKMAKILLHTWNTNYMTVVEDKGYGFIFAKGSANKLPRPNPTTVNKFNNIGDFFGIYMGRLDGRKAKLTIARTSSGKCLIELVDLDRNVTFKTVRDYLPFNVFRHHEVKQVTLRSEDGRSTKVLKKMYMHTQNTNYISGITTWKNKEYGMFFVRQRVVPTSNSRIQPESHRIGVRRR
ncbi:MAG: hypothetical protein ACPGVB_09270 [Chitinophagales bacterium]